MGLLIPAPGRDCREGFSSMVSYLRRLEAESIHIMREVAGEFRRPVMLYSTGKGSSVMLHLAREAFHLSRPPFPPSNWTESDVWRYIEPGWSRSISRVRWKGRSERAASR